MKRFLIDILIFLVILLGIAVVGDIIISRGLRKTTIRPYAVWNDIYNGTNLNNDMVFLGASSCWAGVNPCVIDSILGISSYNLGIDGHPWSPCQPLRYDTYVRFAPKPKYVVIVIDESTFAIQEEPYEREQFFPYFWIDDSLVTQVRGIKQITFMDRYCPLWRYIGYRKWIEAGVASTFGKQHFEDDGVYKGHRGNDWPWERASLDILDSITLDIKPCVIDSLIAFIDNRKEEGQEVILVKIPIFHELQERFTNHQEMCRVCDSIAAVKQIPLIDYWNHPIVQDNSYFYNSTHLNIEGANLISCQLAHDIECYLTRLHMRSFFQ